MQAGDTESSEEQVQLIKPPIPDFKIDKTKTTRLTFNTSRGARLLEMSKAKGDLPSTASSCSSNGSPNPMLMSPMPVLATKSNPETRRDVEALLTTPTQSGNQPWQKFVPSPCDASPSAGILKRSTSEVGLIELVAGKNDEAHPLKRRRVQFTDPPVSEQVVIPRCPSGKATRQKLQETRFNQKMFLQNIAKDLAKGPFDSNDTEENNTQSSEEGSVGLYEATPPLDGVSPNCVYPSLVECKEPVSSILHNLASKTWLKHVEKNLKEHNIETIADLSKLTIMKANDIKSLMPPNNLFTIREALRKFEKALMRREKEKKVTIATSSQEINGINDDEQLTKEQSPTTPSPVVDDASTPEEEDETMKELYERPSPSPTEVLETVDPLAKDDCQTNEETEGQNVVEEPPVIVEKSEAGTQVMPELTTSGTMTFQAKLTDAEVECKPDSKEKGTSTKKTKSHTAHCQTNDISTEEQLQETKTFMASLDTTDLIDIISLAAELLKTKQNSH